MTTITTKRIRGTIGARKGTIDALANDSGSPEQKVVNVVREDPVYDPYTVQVRELSFSFTRSLPWWLEIMNQ
jgi:hypothetical protein